MCIYVYLFDEHGYIEFCTALRNRSHLLESDFTRSYEGVPILTGSAGFCGIVVVDEMSKVAGLVDVGNRIVTAGEDVTGINTEA